MIALSEERLRSAFGLGVAGNFAGHLEQAGEDRDFTAVAADEQAPKGVFPFYVPGGEGFLGQFPISSERIAWTDSGRLQIEPEAGLLCGVDYDDAGAVRSLSPLAITAFNDCSARRDDASRISEKKNWGADSKGVARQAFELSEIGRDGACSVLRIACFLRRDGETHIYGVDSAVRDYSYFGRQLLDWTVERLLNQTSEPSSPLEDVGALLTEAGHPPEVLIGIGATRYTEFGEVNFLRPGDQSIVILYDSEVETPASVLHATRTATEDSLDRASVLRQLVS